MGSKSNLLLLLLFLLFSHRGAPDLAADRAALLSFRSAVGPYLRWNLTSPTPCAWPGVTCELSRVTALRLPGSGLVGPIPSPLLGNLTALRSLSLRFNAISGPLPSDLSSLSQLRYLYLQGNKFSGSIPPSLSSLQSLIRLNLAQNNFSGQIPSELSSLTNLGTLYLETNSLEGQMPDLHLPSLIQLNLSFNPKLTGSIPSRLQSLQANSFLNTSLCGGPMPECPSLGRSDGKLSGGAVAGIVIGSVAGFLILLAVFMILRSRKAKRGGAVRSDDAAERSISTDSNEAMRRLTFFSTGVREYDLEDLLKASAEVLGKGTFGTTYKAVVGTGVVMAVKRLKEGSVMVEKEFRERIAVIGEMEHRNLVGLKGYYYSKEERLLVYDYMAMGSLSSLLHGEFHCSYLVLMFDS